jgi:hypothetical protein
VGGTYYYFLLPPLLEGMNLKPYVKFIPSSNGKQ